MEDFAAGALAGFGSDCQGSGEVISLAQAAHALRHFIVPIFTDFNKSIGSFAVAARQKAGKGIFHLAIDVGVIEIELAGVFRYFACLAV